MHRSAKQLCVMLLAAFVFAVPAGVDAFDKPSSERQQQDETEDPPRVHEGFGLRTGLMFHGLFAAPDASVMRYLDFGMRRKSGEYYLELRAPALMVIIDGLITLGRSSTRRRSADFLFESLNSGDPPGHWELGHGRMGYRFLLKPPGDYELWEKPWEAAAGVFATADLVMFDLRRDLSRADVRDFGYNDPLVVGAGAFFSVGRTRQDVQYDVALGVGQAIVGFDTDPDRDLTFVTLDADVQFTFGLDRIAFYMRPRLTGYITDMEPAIHVAGGLTAGVGLGF